jgi:peptide/nickel transport system substrate-binding protein
LNATLLLPVDGQGHQLPHIDRVVFTIASSKIIPAKTEAGESDLQHVI